MRLAIAACMLLFMLGHTRAHADDFFLHHGDRVVFFGDSITEQKLYTKDIEDFVFTRYPERRIDFVQSGWGGERVDGGTAGAVDDRLQQDVIAYRPSVVVVMLGMNDGRYQPSNPARIEAYRAGLEHIVQRLTGALPSARIVLLMPSPYDDVTRSPSVGTGYNRLLLSFAQVVQEIGKERHLIVIDLNGPVVAMLEAFEKEQNLGRSALIPDRIHPSAAVHLLMAQTILKAWDAMPVVSAVSIDSAQDTALQQENTTVSAVWTWGRDLTWSQTDTALPFFVDTSDPLMEQVIALSNFEQNLNREELQVHKLAPGNYKLWIDDREIGEFTNTELEAGTNLSVLNTPMLEQAAHVHHLIAEHNDVHTVIRRQLRYFYPEDQSAAMTSAVEALQSLDNDAVARARLAAKPQMHTYVLRSIDPDKAASNQPK